MERPRGKAGLWNPGESAGWLEKEKERERERGMFLVRQVSSLFLSLSGWAYTSISAGLLRVHFHHRHRQQYVKYYTWRAV